MRSVKAKLTAGMILISILAMVIVTVIVYVIARNIIIDESLNKIKNIVAQEATGLDGWLGEYKSMLSVLGTDFVLRNDKADIKNAIDAQAKAKPQLLDLYVGFSDDSGVFAYYEAPADWLASKRGWYTSAMNANGKTVNQVYNDFSTGAIQIAFSQSIGKVGGLDAVVACDISLDSITEKILGIDVAKDAYVFLTDENGGIISHPDKKYSPTSEGLYQITDSALYNDLLNKLKSSNRVKFTDSDEIIRYMIPCKTDEGWMLYASVPEAAIMESFNSGMIWIIAAFVLIILLTVAIITLTINALIVKPIDRLMTISRHMINGNLNENINISVNDEFGKLSDAFAEVANTFKRLIADLCAMSQNHEIGEIDDFLVPDDYKGEYSEVAKSVNMMVQGHIETKKLAMSCVAKMASGEFDAPMEKLPGKKAFINDAIEEMRANIKNVGNEVNRLVREALNGNLSAKADISGFNGGWLGIGKELNELMSTVSAPIQESLSVLTGVSKGDLQSTMRGEYKGEFQTIKEVVNSTVAELRDIIENVSDTLTALSNDNYNLSVTKQYNRDFMPIKNGLNTIIERINSIMLEINSSAEQVASGSRQISQTAMTLSHGSSEQASAVLELDKVISIILEQTKSSTETAVSANKIAKAATDNAMLGSQDMNNMLDAMNGISNASNEISKIIKTIEDIAFQTNLLALNAAVEAARAGEHGKGFAVVADEVRSLSVRSSESAKQTGALIEEAIGKINLGMKIANETSSAFQVVVNDISDITSLISIVASSSLKQAESVESMNTMVSQISAVTQSNASASEEESAAAEELSSQADTFKSMVARFQLRKDK